MPAIALLVLLLFSGFASSADTNSFTIVALPDTQKYSETHPEIFTCQTAWVVSNRDALGIAFVSHLGDVVEHGTSAVEYVRADAAMHLLDGVVPYSVTAGNHDLKSGTLWDQYFGPKRYEGRSWYGGASPDGRSHFQTFDACGRTFLHINLRNAAPSGTLLWAQGVVDRHQGLPTIVSAHDYMTGANRTANGERIWSQFVRVNPQVFMVLAGHIPGEGRMISTNAVGRNVMQLLSDYQVLPRGGDGYLRIIRFVFPSNRIEVQTYSPLLDCYGTSPEDRFACDVTFSSNITVNGWVPAEPSAPEK